MLGQCLRRFQSIHQQSAERNPWRDVSIFQPDWTWNTSLTILVQKTEQHAAGSQSIGSQQDSARKIDESFCMVVMKFAYLHSCWSPLKGSSASKWRTSFCSTILQSSSLANPNLLSVVDRFTLLQRSPVSTCPTPLGEEGERTAGIVYLVFQREGRYTSLPYR